MASLFSAGDGNQGFMHIRHALYQLHCLPSPVHPPKQRAGRLLVPIAASFSVALAGTLFSVFQTDHTRGRVTWVEWWEVEGSGECV